MNKSHKMVRFVGFLISLISFSLYASAQTRINGEKAVRKAYINVKDIYKQTNNQKFTSIYLPLKMFKGYQYIAVRASKNHGARVHILKEEPKRQNEKVHYSDYYNKCVIVQKGMKLDIVIPPDAKCIYILNSAGNNYKPDSIELYSEESISIKSNAVPRRNEKPISQKFMHWNIGHFSKGKKPYSIIKEDNYRIKLDGFNNFINTYCPDCHYLLNEYDDIFATVDGKPINTPAVLFDKRADYKVFPRTTSSGYNKLAIFWKDGLISYKYGVFECLKGVKNSNGTLEYGTGYCVLQYAIGEEVLYVMCLHAPNGIKREEYNALYREILKICSDYDNCVLVGDFNRININSFRVLTSSGFRILNDKSITAPSTGHIADWVLYRCKNVTLSDFRVYTEAMDGNGEFLSDHLPLSFTATYKARN